MDSREMDFVAVRFGLGPQRDGEDWSPAGMIASVAASRNGPALDVPSSASRIIQNQAMFQAIKEAKGEADKTAAKMARNKWRASSYQADVSARIAFGVMTPFAFAERLLAFWSNHFSVSRKGILALLAGPYEAEALYPNLGGSFVTLLKAAEHHAAMLEYLNQDKSVGPNSPQGKETGRGLNENLAREILELHTLGVHGGYAQGDVTEFAKIMTGWTIDRKNGAAMFRPRLAEPGPHKLLGQTFGGAEPRAENFDLALEMLASHPATASHIATKLVIHFISDDPPPEAVAAVEKRFTDTDGDLAEVYRTLVSLPEAGAPTGAKARTDRDFLIAALRAVDIAPEKLTVTPNGKKGSPLVGRALRTLHHQYWDAPSPAGWPESADEWLNPTGLAGRFEVIPRIVQAADGKSPADLMTSALGATASDRTKSITAAASNKVEAMSLVLASPEFNRR